jgi:uncharacterized membrane protein
MVLFVLLLLGLFFRLATLDGKVFWVDEAFTALRISGHTEVEAVQAWQENPLTTAGDLLQQYQFPGADTSVLGTIRGLATFEPQLPPLYFVLTRWWVELWGNSIVTIRSFGAIASLATLPLLALLCRELFSTSALPPSIMVYVSMALMAVSPFQVVYAQEARPYSLWTFLTVLSSWALLRAIRLRKPLLWLVYGVTLTLSLYTFLYTVFVMLAHGLYVGWLNFQPPKDENANAIPTDGTPDRSVGFFLLSAAGAILAFIPWIGAIARHWQQGLSLATWQRQPLEHRFLTLPLNWALHISRTVVDFNPDYGLGGTPLLPYGLVILAVVVGMGYALYQLHQNASQATWRFVLLLLVVPALGVILPDLVTGGQQSMASRYFAPCWIGLNLVLAVALVHSLQYRLGQIILAGVLSLSVLSCATSALAPAWWNNQGGYIPYVAKAINQAADPLVVSSSDWWLLSLAHDLKPETAVQMVTQLDQVPEIAPDYTHYFLYTIPPEMQVALTQQQGWRIQPFDGLDQVPIACMSPANAPATACPQEAE